MVRVFDCDNGRWDQLVDEMDSNGEETTVCIPVSIDDVTLPYLLREWEDLVFELSEKEVELLKLKEYIQSESFHLETTVDFKELYGKNNADVRKHHIKTELADVYDEVQGLELSINWIRSYIPLLREVIKTKRD